MLETWYKGKVGRGGGWKCGTPPLQKFKTLSKIWRSTAWLASKLWTIFPLNLLEWELRKYKTWERAFFFHCESLKNTVLHKFLQKKYVLIDWVGGRTENFIGSRWRSCTMIDCQLSSRRAQTYSVNKHFIICPVSVENFENFVST